MKIKQISVALGAIFFAAGSSVVLAQSYYHQTSPSVTTTTVQTTPNGKNAPVVVMPSDIKWVDGPDFLPTGAQIATLDGNLKSGPFTVRVKLPANYQIGPHFTMAPKRLTVISGSVNMGLGDKLDTNSGTTLSAGTFAVIPAKVHHYFWTTEETVVQVSGVGPLQVKYVNLTDDPRKAGAKPTTTPAPTTPGSIPSTDPSMPAGTINNKPVNGY